MKTIFSIVLCILLFCNSCIIFPTLCDVPMLEGKNDLVITTGVSIPMPAVNASVAYGITDHVAIQSHGYACPNGYVLQQSLGYYTRTKRNTIFENFYGIAYGDGETQFLFNDYYLSGTYTYLFTQCNFGKTSKKSNDIKYGSSYKIGILYSDIVLNNFGNPEPLADNGILCSYQWFVRFGEGRIKYNFYTQVQASFGHAETTFPVGIGFSLQYRNRKDSNN